jgi:hypothetical protein
LGIVSRQAPPSEPTRPKRQILGPTGLVVMVVVILAFTAASIVIELAANRGRSYKATVDILAQVPGDPNEFQVVFHVANVGNKAGRPDKCEANLLDIKGDRVGTATISLREPIQPGQTYDELATGTAARPPVSGSVHCRSLDPG